GSVPRGRRARAGDRDQLTGERARRRATDRRRDGTPAGQGDHSRGPRRVRHSCVPDAKTEAGVREVEMTLYLRGELLAYSMDRKRRGLPSEDNDFFFGTNTGKRRDRNRLRDRILCRAVDRANADRAKSGLRALPPITPHSLP